MESDSATAAPKRKMTLQQYLSGKVELNALKKLRSEELVDLLEEVDGHYQLQLGGNRSIAAKWSNTKENDSDEDEVSNPDDGNASQQYFFDIARKKIVIKETKDVPEPEEDEPKSTHDDPNESWPEKFQRAAERHRQRQISSGFIGWGSLSWVVSVEDLIAGFKSTFKDTIKNTAGESYKTSFEYCLEHKATAFHMNFMDFKGCAEIWPFKFNSDEHASPEEKHFQEDFLELVNHVISGAAQNFNP